METLTKKTFTSSRSLTYTYYDSAPNKLVHSDRPVLYLLHGFPDSAHLFQNILPRLAALPHRIIIPDQLGYGGTDKPTDPRLFNSRDSSTDHAELLAHEQVSRIVPVGHDWGSFSAQRLWLWRPDLCAGVALLNVPYMPPEPQPFDLDAVNTFYEAHMGFPRFAYWELFTGADGASVIDAHLESFWAVLHGNRKHWMRDMFGVRGAMRAFIEADKDVELHEYAKPGNGWKEQWFKSVTEGGIASALCWYKAMKENHHYAVEKKLPEERFPITVPSFYLGCWRDDTSPPESIDESRKAGLLPDLTVQNIDSAHWCLMEKPDEVGKMLYEWITEQF